MQTRDNNFTFSFLLFAILVFSHFALNAQESAFPGIRTVVIDAGHGGKDPGCHGSYSNEKEVTLGIALKLGKYIEDKYPDIKVIYTRKTDVFIELDERAQIANRNNADLFICIHANAGPSKAFGAETYVLGLHRTEAQQKVAERENAVINFEENAGEKYDANLSADAIIARQLQLSVFLDHSIMFATKLQNQFKSIGRSDRGVRQAGFLVLYKTTMPSVLIETGFLTNPNEEKFLADTSSQRKMAKAMFTAFEEYKVYYESANQSIVIGSETATDFGMSEAEVKSEEIIFRVQIETSSTPLEKSDARFKGLDVWMYENSGLYKYTVGIYRSFKEANELKQKMREMGFEYAFVVAFKNGERIKIDEAIKNAQP